MHPIYAQLMKVSTPLAPRALMNVLAMIEIGT